jgi:hypothetical protein
MEHRKYFKILMPKIYTLAFIITLTAFPSGYLFAENSGDIKKDTTLLNGLVSYWPLDEEGGTRNDVINGNNLTDNNTVISATGLQGTAADFERGNNRYGFTPDPAEYLSINDATQSGLDIAASLSISAWIKVEDVPPSINDSYTIASKSSEAGGQWSWAFRYGHWDNVMPGERHLDFMWKEATGSWSANSWDTHKMVAINNLESGTFHFVTVTANVVTQELKFYVDGVQVGTTQQGPSSFFDSSAPFIIGGYDNGAPTSIFDGQIDEVGLWNRALTSEEVTKLYNDGKGLPYEVGDEPEGNSSIAFLPGITGSRLYRPDGDGEDQIWESVKWKDVEELGFDTNGQSLHADIYTRDIVDVLRPLTGWWDYAEGYQGWMQFLNNLVATDVIEQWKAIPYDWRLATNDLVTLGSETSFDKISYLTGEQEDPYIIGQLEAIADGSPTGKVTVVAHSNGGLVIKNVLKYLEEKGDTEMLAKIDTVVLVAVPQLGTSKTLGELLHGTIPFAHSAAREALEDMPGAYGLIPSPSFYTTQGYPVIEFDERVASLPTYTHLANVKLDTFDRVKNFLSGVEGIRTEPDIHDLSTPNILNSALLGETESMHRGLDSWEAPEGVRVIELVGTGLNTVKSVLYSDCAREHCPATNANYLSHEWGMTSEGDGTVVTKSAEGGVADETYYVALDRLNAGKQTSYVHGTILSVPPVQEFILENVIEGDASTPLPYLMGTDSTKTASYPRFVMRAYSPVDLHLYSSDKHTGIVKGGPTYEMGREYEQDVVNSFYEEWGDVKYIGADFSQGPVKLEIDGTGVGVFTLVVDMYDGDTKTGSFVFTDVAVGPSSFGSMTLTEGGVPMIQYDFDGDGNIDREIAPDGEVLTIEEYFAKLKAKVASVAFPKITKQWLLLKINVAEKLVEKGKRGNYRAAEIILRNVVWSFDRKIAKYVSEEDVTELTALVHAILELIPEK